MFALGPVARRFGLDPHEWREVGRSEIPGAAIESDHNRRGQRQAQRCRRVLQVRNRDVRLVDERREVKLHRLERRDGVQHERRGSVTVDNGTGCVRSDDDIAAVDLDGGVDRRIADIGINPVEPAVERGGVDTHPQRHGLVAAQQVGGNIETGYGVFFAADRIGRRDRGVDVDAGAELAIRRRPGLAIKMEGNGRLFDRVGSLAGRRDGLIDGHATDVDVTGDDRGIDAIAEHGAEGRHGHRTDQQRDGDDQDEPGGKASHPRQDIRAVRGAVRARSHGAILQGDSIPPGGRG